MFIIDRVNIPRDKKVVIMTKSESLARELKHRGFEQVGMVGDNVQKPRSYTLWGKLLAIDFCFKEALEIVGKSRYKQKEHSDVMQYTHRNASLH